MSDDRNLSDLTQVGTYRTLIFDYTYVIKIVITAKGNRLYI